MCCCYLIENGDVYAPESLGKLSIMICGQQIVRVGNIDRYALDRTHLEYELIDVTGCIITPGFIDPHQHLLGGSGEGGFSLQTPPIFPSEIIHAGVTTVVGTLGVDTTLMTPSGLLGKVKALQEEGLGAYMWSGGYNVPPDTITDSIREDILFISEVIGAGEIAVSDQRSVEPTAIELARLISDTHIGGLLSGKAGLTHIHLGESGRRLALLREILNDYDVEPGWIYPTHINRSKKLVEEAIELANKKSFVDIDTTDGKLSDWFTYYREQGGPLSQLTISSDSSLTGPKTILDSLRDCVQKRSIDLQTILPCVTSNTASALKLKGKGRLQTGSCADILVLDPVSLEVLYLFAGGSPLLFEGKLVKSENFLTSSSRSIHLEGRGEK